MTVYVADSEVDLLGAHFEEHENREEATMKVWFAYKDTNKDGHRGVKTAHLTELKADGGVNRIVDEELGNLPNARIRGNHPWAKRARGKTDGDE